MKTTINRIDVYYDETGDRIRQLFVDAEVKRKEKQRGRKLILFWALVFVLGWALVFVKLFTMGAVVGIK